MSEISKDNKDWGFVKPDESVGKDLQATFPVTLRVGDFNMDGYPDILALLKESSSG